MNVLGPAGILALTPLSLLLSFAIVPVSAVTPLVVILHVIVLFDAAREWRKRRTRPERRPDPLWLVSRFLVLVCCPGLGWLVLQSVRMSPDGTGRVLVGLAFLGLPAAGLVMFAFRLYRYIQNRRAFAETAPRIHIDLTGWGRAFDADADGGPHSDDRPERLSAPAKALPAIESSESND